MATIPESLAIALQHHQTGRFQDAEQIYRQILTVDPNCIDAWNLLSVVASQTGQHQFAIQCAHRALELNPNSAELHYNLGVACQDQGKISEAMTAYSKALDLDPNHVKALNNLGYSFHQQGNLAEATACHRRARDLNPGAADTHFNLGNDLLALENWNDAIRCYQRALDLNPDWGEAHSNLGDALQARGDLSAAVASYRRALVALPNSAQVHTNLGVALQKLDEWDEAIACLRRAVQLSPDLSKGRLNLASALHSEGNLEESSQHIRHALQLNPNDVHAINPIGLIFRDQGQPEEARQCFERSLVLQPDNPEAHTNLAMLLLASGDFDRGWPEYEWRWKTKETLPRRFDQPLWDGCPLHEKTIFLHSEQGLGDTLQFIRYTSLVKQLGATVIVECPKPLVPLLKSCSGIDRLLAQGEAIPPFDLHAPLLSLPGLFKTNIATVPATIPYLSADPNLINHWREKLDHLRGFRIGINWQGRAGKGMFRRRDIPLACFAPLAELPVVLINLQKGAPPEELAAAIGQPIYSPGEDIDTAHGPFMDTAAIMKNLDLVISSDTSTPHLAGALGVPVWIALPFVASWQWMRDRLDSPWYPTARLFRQRSAGDWKGVFEEIKVALSDQLFNRR